MLKTDDCLCYTSKSITYTVYPEFLMSKGFSLAPLAIGDSEHFIKNLLAHLIYGFSLRNDFAGIDVNIGCHFFICFRISCDFNNGCNRTAGRGSASCGKEDELCSACNHSCDRINIFPRRIHKIQTMLLRINGFGILQNTDDWASSCFVDAPK